ncbi:hypothetical protein C8R44DRAFT_985203 [Mycena epipterygia]|nr:hypothetical protein C8R44DRAFT_985203 [Mycena epipterygia]
MYVEDNTCNGSPVTHNYCGEAYERIYKPLIVEGIIVVVVTITLPLVLALLAFAVLVTAGFTLHVRVPSAIGVQITVGLVSSAVEAMLGTSTSIIRKKDFTM